MLLKKVFIFGMFSFSLFGSILVDEHFKDISTWEVIKFEKINHFSTYTPSSSGLVLESNHSASALVLKQEYELKEFPIIEFEWKALVCNIDGDSRSKSGDDYPLRIYVAWEYDSAQADWIEKISYEALKLFYGKYPPKAVLNYVMSPKEMGQTSFTSPYTDKVKIIPLDSCENSLGQWKAHRINVVQDYQKIFGMIPRGKATLGIMADSDNTEGNSLATISYIIVRSDSIQ